MQDLSQDNYAPDVLSQDSFDQDTQTQDYSDGQIEDQDYQSQDQEGGNFELAVPFGLTLLAHWMADDGDTRLLDDLESGVSDGYDTLRSYLPFSEAPTPQRRQAQPRQAQRRQTQRRNQTGGNILSNVVLKSLEELIVPLGLMSGAHLLQGWDDRRLPYQTGGNKRHRKNQQDGGNLNTLMNLSVPLGLTAIAYAMDEYTSPNRRLIQSGGQAGGLPIIGDTTLGQWMSQNNIGILSPQTLLPLGVIFVLYWAYRRYALPDEKVKLSQKPTILDMADPEDLAQYARERGINELDAETEFPYAMAMGPEVFKQYVQQNPGPRLGGVRRQRRQADY